jgi:hypothetical protein
MAWGMNAAGGYLARRSGAGERDGVASDGAGEERRRGVGGLPLQLLRDGSRRGVTTLDSRLHLDVQHDAAHRQPRMSMPG